MFIELTKVTQLQDFKVYVNVYKIQFIEHGLSSDDGAFVQLDEDCFNVKESYDVVKNMIAFASRENHSL